MAEEITPNVEPAATEEAPAVEQPKRRRGRPRKVAVEETPEAASAAGEEAPAEEAPKRRRGRPRKVAAPIEEAPADQPAAPSEEPAPSPESVAADETPAPEAPKRRRGRPRKTEAAAAAEAAPAPEAAPAEAKPEEPAPAGDAAAPQLSIEEMTKATQAATKASSVPMGAPATTLAEADAQQGTGRRRRRNDGNGQGQQNNQGNAQQQNNRRNNNQNNRRRNRRERQEQTVEPSLTREELADMKVAELRVKAAELGVEYVGLRKKELADAIYEAAALAEGFRPVSGVLEIQNEGYGFLRTGNYMSGESDAFVHQQLIRQHGLRVGDKIVGSLAPSRSGNKYPPLHRIDSVNGRPLEEMRNRPRFRDLTPIYPDQRLVMEHGQDSITGRAIDLVAPIGKGQRGLIVSPPKAGKTTVLKRICQSIAANNPEVHLFCLLVDERPEEVTDMERSIRGEVVASTFDMPAENHTKVSELVIEHAKRLVELGEDVVVVLDSITRLARAYNLAQPASGRILSGGVDSAALYPP